MDVTGEGGVDQQRRLNEKGLVSTRVRWLCGELLIKQAMFTDQLITPVFINALRYLELKLFNCRIILVVQ